MPNDAPLTVIGSFVSPYVRKVLAALELKNIAYRVDPITPFFGNDEFQRLSPLRRIPVLIDGDTVVNDSSIICAYLDETRGGHALYPGDAAARARARWIEEYADSRLGELTVWGLFYQRFVRRMVWDEPADEERVRDTIENGLPHALDHLETILPSEGWIFGEIGVADIAVATFFQNAAYAGYSIDPERWPVSAAFVSRVLGHPVIQKLGAWEAIQLSATISGRRQALIGAGAPLSETTWAERTPRRGVMTL
ncbi:glutathione S-transferase family protein [Sphingomonas sp. HDW15A]|uniref:glutathione S-transferase family protein n=1 Tax=Sphingomonas sp. HDW15A TaxID=2714942 RepID=UPI0014091D92|nr:glutathione S-transferase family protein [Sphingomonas sp. HDW15A]QIK96484.1 glutathione S-transferase family protein [Sphingomonas sp. HDW15A]